MVDYNNPATGTELFLINAKYRTQAVNKAKRTNICGSNIGVKETM